MPNTATPTRRNKHVVLDQTKLKKAQKLLGAKTETETLDRALDHVIGEAEKDRRLRTATERFIKSGIEIKDVYGRLDGE